MQQARKQFIKECALYIRGDVSQVRLRGDTGTVKLFANALSESRKFYLALQEGDFKDAIVALKKKRAASSMLREQTGYVWPL